MKAVARSPTTSLGEEIVARWWRGEYGFRGALLRTLLTPAEALFRMAVWLRNGAYDGGFLGAAKVGIPVVSVGNLTVGGTGKTPVAGWLVDELLRRGHRPAVLHGGYADDEPALHRVWHPDVPVFVRRDRVESARRAIACGSTAVVLDDGFQYRHLHKDVEILLVAAESWTPRPRLLPNGPWRESPAGSLGRADLIAVTRKTGTAAQAIEVMQELRQISPETPLACLHLQPSGFRRGTGERAPPGGNVLAVAGVAQPALFAENARSAGADVTDVLVFPDHHPYEPRDAERILAAAAGRDIVMTAKDYVKLEPLLPQERVWVLLQRVTVETGSDALARIHDGLPA